MAAIFKRETKSYYTGMVGYVTAAVSLFFLGLYFTNRNLMYASSDFASVLYTTTLIMLFLLPAISMRSFAEDRRNKTDQLLLTSPVSIPGIVLGKFLAEVVVFALPLTVAVIMPLILTAFGTVSLVSAFSALFAYLLLGAACLAVGTWISALTENQIIAYLATFGALLIAYLRKMNDELNIPHGIQHYGADSYPCEQGFVPESVFLERLPEIARNAIADACTGSNPRQPTQEEMEKLLKCCYYDTEVDF